MNPDPPVTRIVFSMWIAGSDMDRDQPVTGDSDCNKKIVRMMVLPHALVTGRELVIGWHQPSVIRG